MRVFSFKYAPFCTFLKKPSFVQACIAVAATMTCVLPTARADDIKLKPRVETNIRAGTERSILMTEAWFPLAQDSGRVVFGDVRLMGDDRDNREWNFGLGYREVNDAADAVMGVHGWFDRRRSKRGSVFYQIAGGFEYFSDDLDIRLNAYIPFNQEELYAIPAASTTPYLADTGIYYDSPGVLAEKPLHGFDVEFSIPVKALQGNMESFRVSAGGFVFKGDDVDSLHGYRLRAAADVTQNIEIGARFESDNQRGTQGFLEATLRFPFGSKASAKTLGIRSRLDESPERDIDVITAARTAVPPQEGLSVLNAADNTAQRVFHVDNSQAANGDGSLDNPFNNLADANTAADRAGDVIYINRGTGTSLQMDSGAVLALDQQSIIGAGTDFVYDGGRFTTSTGANFNGTVLVPAGAAPVLSNTAGHGVTITGEDACIAGVTVDGAFGHGIFAAAGAGGQLGNLMIKDVALTNNTGDGLRVETSGAGGSATVELMNTDATGNQNGMRFYAHDDASISGSIARSVLAGNTQHGLILYDDSAAGSVDIDAGGGGESVGHNSFYGNGMEDVALDLDGGTLFARNNWWGQAGGPYQALPSGALKPQIYYGAPLYDGLLLHLTLDSEWTSATTAYDRSGNAYNGTLTGGLNLTDMVAGARGEGLNLNGTSDYVRVQGIVEDMTQYTVMSWTAPDKTTAGSADQNTYGFSLLSDGVPTGSGPYPLWVTLKNSEVIAHTFNTSNVATGKTTSGAGIANGTWHAVDVSSTKGGETVIYVDGADAHSFNNPGNSASWTNGNLYIGELRAGRNIYYDGTVDDIRVYNRILTDAEVAEIYRMDTTSAVNNGGFLTADPN
jgi:hypothetical protein